MARLVFREGQKVEISFEDNRLCGAWFPAVVVEDLGGNFLLVEYKCAGINGEERLRRLSVDKRHIRPSYPKFKDISFGLFDKVEAFYDFGWWSGVVTKNLPYSRYVVFSKDTKKVKEVGRRELRPHAEWKEEKWLTSYEGSKKNSPSLCNLSRETKNLTRFTRVLVSDDENAENGFKRSEPSSVNCSTEDTRAVGSLNLTIPTKDTIPHTEKETSCSTEKIAAVPLNLTEPEPCCSIEKIAAVPLNLTEPATDTTSVTDREAHRSTELSAAATSSLASIVTRSMKRDKPAGRRTIDKNAFPPKRLKIKIASDDQSPPETGQSEEVSNTVEKPAGPVEKADVGGKTSEVPTKSTDVQFPSDVGQAKEVNNTAVSPAVHVEKADVGGKTSEATKSADDQSPTEAGLSNTPISPSGCVEKVDIGEKTNEATKTSDDQIPSDLGQSNPEKAKARGGTSEATKNISEVQSLSDVEQSNEANTPVGSSGRAKKAKTRGETSEATQNISDNQSPLVASRSKEANTPVGSSGRAKKAKARGETTEASKNISDDHSPLVASQSKDDTLVYPSGRLKRAKAGVKAAEAAKSISNRKKKPGNRVKAVGLKSAGIKSAGKKGEISDDNEGQTTSPEGAKGDSTKITPPDIVEEQQVTQNWPLRFVLGLQCKAVTSLQIKNAETPQSFTPLSPKTTGNQIKKAVTRQSFTPLSPKTTGNQIKAVTRQSFTPLSPKTTGNQKDMVGSTETTRKRKRGRPIKIISQTKVPETPLAVTNETGDATPGAVDGDKTLNRGAEVELAILQDTFKAAKGKRGRRSSVNGLETEAPGQGSQDSFVQRANDELVENSARQNSEPRVQTISDDQPLSRWFEGRQSSATVDNTGKKQLENSNSSLAVANGDAETLSFEKKLSIWKVIEAVEVFRMIPQNPHFRPLNNLKQNAREEQAISKMLSFSCVAENICRLRSTSPTSDIEDYMNSLSELEPHGFDVKMLKKRLTDFLLLKNKEDAGRMKLKNSKVSTEKKSAGAQVFDEELMAIDKQMSELLAKRDAALSKKMKEDADIAELKAKLKEDEEALRELRRQFDELAAAPVWQ